MVALFEPAVQHAADLATSGAEPKLPVSEAADVAMIMEAVERCTGGRGDWLDRVVAKLPLVDFYVPPGCASGCQRWQPSARASARAGSRALALAAARTPTR